MDQGAYQDSLTYLEQAYELQQKLNVPEISPIRCTIWQK